MLIETRNEERMIKQNPYASCSYCGSSVEEQHVRTEIWIGEQLTVFEHVPVGVCAHCGEEYFRADIHEKMLELARRETKKIMSVPVYSFTDPLTVAKSKAKRKKHEDINVRDEELHIATDEELKELSEFEEQDEWEEK